MAEAVYNASGLGLPIVMTIGNRAIGAPINIWNDQSDSMSMRDAGWIQLFAETNQEAADLHIQAFRLAEAALVPGDGLRRRLHPHPRLRASRHPRRQRWSTSILPPFVPRQVLDPEDPVSIGAMVGPEAFIEVRYLQHLQTARSAEADPGDRRRVRRRSSDAHPAAWCGPTAAKMPRRWSSRWVRSTARSKTSSTCCARKAPRSAR